jgi:hypothetical protein
MAILASEKNMADEKREPWLNYLALTTVILAVCATLSTFRGGQYSSRSMLNQSQASDQWAFYQAKSLKGYIYESEKDQLELALKERGTTMSAETQQYIGERMKFYSSKITQYDKEKAEITQAARDLEKSRDEAKQHSQAFGVAVIFLQIAILLSSIAALLKKKLLWYIGMAVGMGGVLYFANGFWLFWG